MKSLPPGSRIGRFEILSVLGEGAMGVVYLAQDPHIERPVAIKTIRAVEDGGARASEIETRFQKEAKLAGRLQHPNIVTIYEFGSDGDVVYIAMEYVDGQPLARYVANHAALSIDERVAIVRQVARALQHAHERGVVHRDVKPGNILVTKDRVVKVADFGIGKLLSGASTDLTRTGTMIGSPAYMSPEQIRGDKIDGRSDFFSLGVVLFELLTGARPFPGDSITTLVYQILHTEPRDPLTLRADLPPAAREVFARLLAKQAERRPAGADEFIREIDRLVSELAQTQVTAPVRAVPPSVPPSPRRPLAHSLFGLAALLVAAAVLVTVWRMAEKRGEPRAAEAKPAAAAVSPEAKPTNEPASAEVPTALPTRGPSEAADTMVVGAPRPGAGEPAPTLRAKPTAAPRAAPTQAPADVSRAAAGAEASPAPATGASREPADRVYHTRRSARFSTSPDQARLFLDGKFVGIADDWDGRGGGKNLEFASGTHRVRIELPGYQALNIDMVVTPGAEDETVKIDDELRRVSRVPYPKIGPGLAGDTRGPVELEVEPADADVLEGEKKIGIASQFGPSSPLKLSGPRVHEFVLTAPGFEPKTIRVLVSQNSGNDRAKIKVKLKKS
jgi:predicted Ser/Thr protein kinase